jgi:hypothetical protein
MAYQQAGSIRGVVYDKDFDVPLGAAKVLVLELQRSVETTGQGNYLVGELAPGTYTLVFSKDGYVRQVRPDVVVTGGQLTEVNMWLPGDFTDMEEFVVQDLLTLDGGSEAALLELRFESPAMMDSIGADLMSKAGASDAASALKLVAGASVAEGKFAVIRGLPDRYVSSQMNGVRLPSADEDKRAVELDQFPAAVIESLQVSKTFTPDQQGDASGGAVDVRLKSIPEETLLQFKTQIGYNSQVTGKSTFLTYEGGGLDFFGGVDGHGVQTGNLGGNWDGAVGTTRGDAPIDYKFSAAAGRKWQLDEGLKVGGFVSLYYEHDSEFFDDGIDDSKWMQGGSGELTPEEIQGTSTDGDFKTALFDVTQGAEQVNLGALATIGIESDFNRLGLTFLATKSAEDKATLAEDTRGKLFYFPDYDPDDPMGAGNIDGEKFSAPYIRTETLEYTERTTATLQLNGHHELPIESFQVGDSFEVEGPRIDWTLAHSSADLDQPDKRQFGARFLPDSYTTALDEVDPSLWDPFKPSANFTFGNAQRLFKTIEEESNQYNVAFELPFRRWGTEPGSLRLGAFGDHVERDFDQDSFDNFADTGAQFPGDYDDSWSANWLNESHPITESLNDVDYHGDQRLTALYSMVDVPISENTSVIGGVRFEETSIDIVNDPEEFATWFPPGATSPQDLDPGEADVSFHQRDALPSIGVVYEPTRKTTLRAGYSQTVARQTFKELTPILQSEYLGGPVFIGDPALQMSELKNYDLRLDYVPYEGGLWSASWFHKTIDGPIEYVQRLVNFTFTTPRNYPDGEMTGYELEMRQQLGRLYDPLEGLSLGVNATFIDSTVNLPADEIEDLTAAGAPITSREMTNAPEHLYNAYLSYDFEGSGNEVALFYTIQGDTLVAGAGESRGNFVPSIYAEEHGSLNLSAKFRLARYLSLRIQAKNLTNPQIRTVYRSDFTGDDVTRTSYTRGTEISFGLSFDL